MATPVQVVMCPKTGNVGYAPIGQGAGQFSWLPFPAWWANVTTAAGSAVTTTETLIVKTASKIPLGVLNVGSAFRFSIPALVLSTVSATTTFRFRYGTAGTTSDQLIGSVGLSSVNTGGGGAWPFFAQFNLVVVTTGGTGTGILQGWLTNGDTNAAAGIIAQQAGAFSASLTNWNTTSADSFLSCSVVTSSASLTITPQAVSMIEVVRI